MRNIRTRRILSSSTLAALFLALSLLTPILNPTEAYAYSGAGNGTELDPFLITSCSEFNEIADDNDAHYELTNDITCNTVNELDVDYFEGTFDGGGYTIEFNQNSDGNPNMGLFGQLGGATVSNLYVIGIVVSNQYNAGLLAGASGGSTIHNVHVVGSVTSASDYVGGMFGFSGCDAQVSNSSAAVDVEGNEYVGGFTGIDGCEGPGTTYNNSHAEGEVNGSSYVGGFIGEGFISKLYDVYTTGNVTAVDNIVGGVVGNFGGFGDEEGSEWWGVMNEVYSTGDVSGNDYVGGIFGRTVGGDIGAFIDRTYAEGTVSGYQYVGGFGGLHEIGIIEESYATGDVLGTGYNVGGFLGEVRGPDVSVSNSYATGHVDLEGSYGGGFIGTIYQGEVYNSYATGDVTLTGEGSERAGAFSAEAFEDEGTPVSITNNFAVGGVSAPNGEGGFIALIGEVTTFENNYWDIAKTGIDTCRAGASLDGCIGVNEGNAEPAYFINNSTNPPLDEWNFSEDLWATQADSYPCFAWQDACEVVDVGEPSPDADQDGVETAVENAGPNSGDANDDGTPDSEQDYVTTFVNPLSGKYVTLETSDECTITYVAMIAEGIGEESDADYDYANGLMDFTLECNTQGFTATVAQYYFGVEPPEGGFTLRKFNPNTSTYTTVDSLSMTTGEFLGQQTTIATYQITDGGGLDMDGEANAVIVDPAGLGEVASTTSSSTSPEALGETGQHNLHPAIASLTVLVASIIIISINVRNRNEKATKSSI